MHHLVSKRPILQFVSIKRKDCGEWAIPGVCDFAFPPLFSVFQMFYLVSYKVSKCFMANCA